MAFEHVIRLATSQHAAVARRQLTALGCTGGQIRGWVRRGRLRREDHGVYVVAGAPLTLLGEASVAALRAGPGARIVGERMLAATGVRDAAADGPFTVLVPPGRRLPAFRHPWRTDVFPACGQHTAVQGIASWCIPRNLLEAAVDAADDDRVAVLADGVRRRRRMTMREVERLVLETPDHVGGRRLLLLGCLDTDATESPPERVLEGILSVFAFRRQVEVVDGVFVDFLLTDLRVVVEYDGSDHESGRARTRDEGRDDRIRAAGLAVVRVTRHDLRDPRALLERIRAAAP